MQKAREAVGVNADGTVGKADADLDPKYLALRSLCEQCMEGGRKGIDVRDGVLVGGDATRLDVFKGREMREWIEKHEELVRQKLELPEGEDAFTETELRGAERLGLKPLVAVACMRMMQHKLFLRLDRHNTKLPPGKKKLPRWPRKYVWHKEQLFRATQTTTVSYSGKRAGETADIDDDDTYYGFVYVRPVQLKSLLQGAALVLAPVLMCLYPIAPLWFKFGVVYVCVALLALIFITIFVRLFVYSVVWLTTGRSFWVFPNLFNDDVPFMDALLPRYGFDKKAGLAKWWSRLTVLALLVAGGVAFYLNAPDEEAVKEMRDTAGNSFDEFMNWATANKQISNGTDTNSTVAEETENPKEEKPDSEKTYEEIFADSVGDLLEEGQEGEAEAEAELSADERAARLDAMLEADEAEDEGTEAAHDSSEL